MSLVSRYAHSLDVLGSDEALHPASAWEDTPGTVARGDSFLDDGEESRLESPLPGVDDERWSQFTRYMIVAPCDAVSPSNGTGMFAMSTRRLADLGLVSRLMRSRNANGKTIWVAVFRAPLTCDRFLSSPSIQYKVFAKSMCDYAKKIDSGEIEKEPSTSLSGALAVLHRAGPHGLKRWSEGDRHPETIASYDRVAGVF